MRTLPDNQGGAGRHKCPYCAYQLGYEQAKRDMADRLTELRPDHGLTQD